MWQEETEDTRQEDMVHIEGELKGEQGFVFSRLMIDAKKESKKKCWNTWKMFRRVRRKILENHTGSVSSDLYFADKV